MSEDKHTRSDDNDMSVHQGVTHRSPEVPGQRRHNGEQLGLTETVPRDVD